MSLVSPDKSGQAARDDVMDDGINQDKRKKDKVLVEYLFYFYISLFL